MLHAVVVGAGVAGLGQSLVLAQRGHQVTLVERDPIAGLGPMTFERRKGIPQARHSHAFLARLRNLLRDEAPAVLQALMDNGVTELRFTDNLPETLTDTTPRPGDEDLVALACRRTTFEDVVRAEVLAMPGVTLVDHTAVDGLVLDTEGPCSRVLGVRAGPKEIRGDVVIDAGGRRSRLPALLAEDGGPVLPEDSEECGIVYLSRFYELKPGREYPPTDGPIGGDLGYLKFAVFYGDRSSFSITFAVATSDAELRTLLMDDDTFEVCAAQLPVTRPYLDRELAAPFTDVALMAGLKNQWRHTVTDGEALVTGLHLVGDAGVTTNPLYGRGCSLAFVHAWALADVLGEHGWGTEEAVLAFDRVTRAEIGPWYEASLASDRASMAAVAGGDAAPGAGLTDILRYGLFPATRTDPEVFRAFIRGFNLLEPPLALMERPDLVAKVMEAYAERDQREEPEPFGPPRDEMLAALTSRSSVGT